MSERGRRVNQRPSVETLVRLRAQYRGASAALEAALRVALRPGDRITVSRGLGAYVAEVLADPDAPRRAYLSGGGPELMRVKVASLATGREYWLHVSRVAELDP